MTEQWVVVAKVGAPHGIKGDLKLHPFTAEQDAVLAYASFLHVSAKGLWQPQPAVIKKVGLNYLIHFQNCNTPEEARHYVHVELAVPRDSLPALSMNEHYVADLVHLAVYTEAGRHLGQVTDVLHTGANDVLVVSGERERLIPYIKNVIKTVDVIEQKLIVDWDPDF